MTQAERQEWLAKRREVMTGTDVGAILGLSSFRGPWDVYADKRGESTETHDNERMEWGRRLESAVASAVCERLNCVATPGAFTRREWMGGTPDFILDFEDGSEQAVLDVKTCDRFEVGKWGENGSDVSAETAPAHYRAQLLWYCALVGVSRGVLAVLIGGNELRILHYREDVSTTREVIEYARQWWQRHVVAGEPPPVDGSDTCRGILGRVVHEDPVDVAEALAEDFQAAAAIAKAADESKSLAYNRLMSALGGATKGTAGRFRISCPVIRGRERVDVDALRAEVPELVERHTTYGAPSRRLTVSIPKEKK